MFKSLIVLKLIPSVHFNVLFSATNHILWTPSGRSMLSYWASVPRTSPDQSAFWWWSVWPLGTRSWTPGSTFWWGRQSWGNSSHCCINAGVPSLAVTRTSGNAAFSAARPRLTSLACQTAAASADFLCLTLPLNPLLESSVSVVHFHFDINLFPELIPKWRSKIISKCCGKLSFQKLTAWDSRHVSRSTCWSLVWI